MTQDRDYRKFALLFCNDDEFLREEYGRSQVLEKKQQLIQNRKLVLVLDLDNTLLHSEVFNVGARQRISSSSSQ